MNHKNFVNHKISFIIIIIIAAFSIKFISLNNNNICLCTVGKKENLYIREFIEYYKKYGVKKIILYDNNELNGENFKDVIRDYINNKFVDLIDYRGERGNLIKIMDDCYQKNHYKYDWLIFYEIDEFIYLKGFSDINSFLKQNKFNKCDAVQLNWVHRSDNNHIYFENKPVSERFTEKGLNVKKGKNNPICFIKTIIRGHLKNIKITNNHYLSNKLNSCNGYGGKAKIKGIINKEPDYDNYYINHYFSKSTEEFVNKIKRGDILRGNNTNINNFQIYKYFLINKLNSEKIKYMKENLGSLVDLSKYIKKLKSNK